MAEPEMLYGTTLSVESMKVIAESIGVGALPDDAAKELADDVSFKIKQIVQVRRHSRKMGLIQEWLYLDQISFKRLVGH